MLVWYSRACYRVSSLNISPEYVIAYLLQDFRSSDGLYALVKEQYPDAVLKGRDLFDASLFRDPTSSAVFYTFISQLKRSIDGASPAPTHRFIKALDQKSKLLRSYTQNIDGLEKRAGLLGSSSEEARSSSSSKGKRKLRIRDVRNVQLHGDIHRVRCTFCSAEMPCTEEHLKQFETGVPPPCPECTDRCEFALCSFSPHITEFFCAHDSGSSSSTLCETHQSRNSSSRDRTLRRTSSTRRRHRVYPNIRPHTKARYAYHHGHLS